jgi:ribosomal protein S27AE
VNSEVCPKCDQEVPMRHTGEPEGFDERTDPRVFVEHDRDDERGRVVLRKWCPGSGRNVWTAEHTS